MIQSDRCLLSLNQFGCQKLHHHHIPRYRSQQAASAIPFLLRHNMIYSYHLTLSLLLFFATEDAAPPTEMKHNGVTYAPCFYKLNCIVLNPLLTSCSNKCVYTKSSVCKN